MGFNGDRMGLNGDLVGLNGDINGILWYWDLYQAIVISLIIFSRFLNWML